MFNELLPIYFVQPRETDVIALGLNESAPQLLIFAAHGVQHHLGGWLEGIQRSRCEPGLHWRQRAATVRVQVLLVRKAQRRDLS